MVNVTSYEPCGTYLTNPCVLLLVYTLKAYQIWSHCETNDSEVPTSRYELKEQTKGDLGFGGMQFLERTQPLFPSLRNLGAVSTKCHGQASLRCVVHGHLWWFARKGLLRTKQTAPQNASHHLPNRRYKIYSVNSKYINMMHHDANCMTPPVASSNFWSPNPFAASVWPPEKISNKNTNSPTSMSAADAALGGHSWSPKLHGTVASAKLPLGVYLNWRFLEA